MQRNIGLSSRTLGSGTGRDRHQHISITPLCTPSVFAPYSAFLFSFRLASPLRFSCLSFYSLAIVIFVGVGPIAGAIYCSGCLLLTHLFVHRFCSSTCVNLTLFYLEFILSELVLLTLGLTSAKSRSHVQLIRAELSSNGSSVPHSESFSKLSSHQIPRCLDIEGTTTAKGLYANLYFVLTHYAFGGVSAQCVLFALSTPLRLRGRTGVFRRREGRPRLPISGLPFFLL